ncbi:acyl-CoA dehydrogenase family protein [Phytohabitans suffuscus]|uniref:Acyl-CoA dehydrogenase n=1 Tax=Phytohabitans suffuscus TaxID=624315 RepID=A0A6F8YR25_9ACTN|nr:acyl-CoA dehydrogenase family protein [Phytohabitans suffuscus]BCB88600.1 acyl-CoA dehydrogenase [Phytohabitans suffuscus]
MEFGLTDEQAALQRVAREFVSDVAPPKQAKEWDEQGVFPAELAHGFAELGWYALPFPESWGGGGGPIELAILAEELGRSSLDVAMTYIGTLIPSLTIFEWGSESQRKALRARLDSGEFRYAVSMSEPDSGSDSASLRTSAKDMGDHYLVNGQKMWCTGAGVPGTQLVMYVRTSVHERRHSGISLLLIDPRTEGLELRQTSTLARHILGTYEVYLQDVVVPKDRLIGPEGEGWKVMLSNLETERVLMSGAYVGVAQATLDDMLSYAQDRKQFGRPIGNFQALAHALADLQTEIDAARLLAHRAAWMLSKGLPCAREGAMAKLKGSETYVQAARLGMQVMAGHGFATESVMSYRWRESIVAPISGGTSQIQRNGIARSMGLKPY